MTKLPLAHFSWCSRNIFLEATSYTRHGTFRTMLRSATPELRHTEMRRTGMRHTETAPHRTCAVLERAVPKCAKLDLRHSGLTILARHSGLRHSGMTPHYHPCFKYFKFHIGANTLHIEHHLIHLITLDSQYWKVINMTINK